MLGVVKCWCGTQNAVASPLWHGCHKLIITALSIGATMHKWINVKAGIWGLWKGKSDTATDLHASAPPCRLAVAASFLLSGQPWPSTVVAEGTTWIRLPGCLSKGPVSLSVSSLKETLVAFYFWFSNYQLEAKKPVKEAEKPDWRRRRWEFGGGKSRRVCVCVYVCS